MSGGHCQEIPNAHGFEIGTGLRRRVVGEKLQHLVVDAQFALGDCQSDGCRGETLAQRIHLMRSLRIVGRPPALGDDFAMPDEHEAVKRIDLLIRRLDESEDGCG